MELTAQQKDILLELARQVVRARLSGVAQASIAVPADQALHQNAGAFVSLHEQLTHRLRGCVGRLDATQPMYQAVAHAASNVVQDPRFANNRLQFSELWALEIEISLIAPLRPAENPLDFEPKADGIFLTIDGRSGCFLPQVARDTGWTREQLLDRLATEKLGLTATAWRLSQARLHKFTAVLIGPEAFEHQNHRVGP